MNLIVFADGPLKGHSKFVADRPKEIFQPIKPQGVEAILVYTYEVDRDPFNGDEAQGYEAHQVALHFTGQYSSTDWSMKRAKLDFGPSRREYNAVMHDTHQAQMDEFMLRLGKLEDEFDVTWEHGYEDGCYVLGNAVAHQ